MGNHYKLDKIRLNIFHKWKYNKVLVKLGTTVFLWNKVP